MEWYRNGVKLPTGHRFRTFHDFGIVILDILYCYAEDSGEYECRAVNKVGSDVTKATLRCGSKASLILTPQMPKVKGEDRFGVGWGGEGWGGERTIKSELWLGKAASDNEIDGATGTK